MKVSFINNLNMITIMAFKYHNNVRCIICKCVRSRDDKHPYHQYNDMHTCKTSILILLDLPRP